MKVLKEKTFLIETNRSARTTRENCQWLRGKGYDPKRLPHQPTVIILRDPLGRPWSDTRTVVAGLAKTPKASIVVMSGQTGKVYQLDRHGNRPARWISRE